MQPMTLLLEERLLSPTVDNFGKIGATKLNFLVQFHKNRLCLSGLLLLR